MNNDSGVSALGRLEEAITQCLAKSDELWLHGESRVGKSSGYVTSDIAESASPLTSDGDTP